MSIQELESLLPHMIRDGFTWPEILSRRERDAAARADDRARKRYEMTAAESDAEPGNAEGRTAKS